jgi:hypothetical protein
MNAWYNLLKDEQSQVVMHALKDCAKTSVYPPVPADICTRIEQMRNAQEPSAAEAFAALKRAAKNGMYGAAEEFEKLPKACKEYLGGASALRDLAMLDLDTLETVTRGQFTRSYETLVNRRRMRESIPDNIRALLDGVIGEMPKIEGSAK